MQSIGHYGLYLLDFDGLLVDTEPYHYRAYRDLIEARGLAFDCSFAQYSQLAHGKSSSRGVRQWLEKLLPELADDRCWSPFYREKSERLAQIYGEEGVSLLPGVNSFLEWLQREHKLHCVVTHSALSLVAPLRESHPLLQKIPHWITREDYAEPKPSGDSYKLAMSRYLPQGARAIGFEDSIRGLQALCHAPVHAAVLVASEGSAAAEQLEPLTSTTKIAVQRVDRLDQLL